MTRGVLTALGAAWESDVVTAVEGTAGYAVARRCADLPDLLAAGAAGIGDVALVAPDLRALDRPALRAKHNTKAKRARGISPRLGGTS